MPLFAYTPLYTAFFGYNEIIIIRTENANLKKIIDKLEQQIRTNNELQNSKDKLINSLKEEIKNLEKNKFKIDIKSNMNNSIKDLSSIITIINNGMNNGNNSKKKINKHNNHIYKKQCYRNNNYINDDSNISTREMHITDRLKKINSSLKHFQLSKYKKIKNKEKKKDLLSTTRNESFDRIKDDFLKKYFLGSSTIKGNINSKNLSGMKISNFPINNNHKIKLVNASAYIPFVSSKRNLNNFFSMKKMLGMGGINYSKSTSRKKKLSNANENNYY